MSIKTFFNLFERARLVHFTLFVRTKSRILCCRVALTFKVSVSFILQLSYFFIPEGRLFHKTESNSWSCPSSFYEKSTFSSLKCVILNCIIKNDVIISPFTTLRISKSFSVEEPVMVFLLKWKLISLQVNTIKTSSKWKVYLGPYLVNGFIFANSSIRDT